MGALIDWIWVRQIEVARGRVSSLLAVHRSEQAETFFQAIDVGLESGGMQVQGGSSAELPRH